MEIKKDFNVDGIKVSGTEYRLLKVEVFKPFRIPFYIYLYMVEDNDNNFLISGYKDFRKRFIADDFESHKKVIEENLVELVLHSLIDNGVYGILEPVEMSIRDGQLNHEDDVYSDAHNKKVWVNGYDEQYDGDIFISSIYWKGQFVVDLDDLEYNSEEGKLFKQYMVARSIEMDEWTDFDSFEYPEILLKKENKNDNKVYLVTFVKEGIFNKVFSTEEKAEDYIRENLSKDEGAYIQEKILY
jgi:hypothetical protein